MKRLISLLFHRGLLTALALVALALLVWIVGPLLALGEWRPLETPRARWITLALIAVALVARLAWRSWRARRGNDSVLRQLLAKPDGDAHPRGESPDLSAVRERFERALATLQRARFGSEGLMGGWTARLHGRYLYELPWYLFIGAPGSGKTTALRNCGLHFPLADTVGADAVRGVGGTRHCDWWFTDRAVLIDTAGRFTTHDSDRDTDRATWSGFLQLLKRSRPRQPINGVLATVSIPELLTHGGAERAQHAASVRRRLQELHEGLQIRYPIYLLVTKCDLLAGFMDYFATLDKDQRAAPWGFTWGVDETPAAALQRFGAEFDALQRRLNDGLIDRLQGERDPQRRARIYGFPGQFAGLRGVLQEFVEAVFAPSPYQPDTLLRGVYFVSGTQEGTPIDRVLGSVARAYGLERAILAPHQASGRSYFLARLVSEVVFAESALAGTDLRWERRRAALAVAGYAAVALLGVTVLALWGTSYAANRRYVADVDARVEKVRQLVHATPNRGSPDLLPIAPALQATRDLADPQRDGALPWSLGFGLYQGDKLDSAARMSYERMLTDAMLPRLAMRIEAQLRQGGLPQGGSPGGGSDYEALKAYVMLHQPDHFEPAALKAQVESDWNAQLGGTLGDAQRAQLGAHLDALLAQGPVVSPLPLDKALVDSHRARLAAISLPQRIYNRMRAQGFGERFPEFTVVGAAGHNAALLFTRASGAPLTQGVSGFFSYDGYHRGFQRELLPAAQALAREQGWVLGIAEAAPAARVDDTLADDVRRIYLNEYAATWESFIADIRLLPMTSLSQSAQMARLLSAPDSPLPALLKAISVQTTLTGGRSVVEKAEQQAAGVVQRSRDAITGLVAPQRAAAAGPRPESIVDERFAGLGRLLGAPEGGGKPPLDTTLALIGEVHLLLNAADTAVKGGGAPPPSDLPNKVRSEAARLPQPVRGMLDNLSQNSARVAQILVRQNLGNEVRSQVGEFCQQAVAGRYPLDRNAARDVTQADFAALFAPGGKLDQLFQQKLAPYVDTTTRPWRFRPVDGTPLGSDAGALPQFQRAAAIRETFFPAGNTPSLRLEFKPVEMDPSLTQFVLDVDGQTVRYAHGPQIPATVQWPVPNGSGQVRVQLSPPAAGGSSGMVAEGPWALLRLFDRVKLEAGDAPERMRATFDIDGRKAVFDVTASSVRNPFRLRELAEFSCPAGL
jgi:type VI secretion system protein ImpL